MKIGLVLDDSLDSGDGVQQYVMTLGAWLGRNGHEVHYLVGETKRTDIPNVHSLSRNLSVRFNRNRMRTPLPASKERLRELMQKERFDVLHVQMPYSPFLAAKIISLVSNDCAVVGTFHIVPFSKLHIAANKALGRWLKPSLARFDSAISVSSAAQRTLKNYFGLESVVLPNVIDASKFKEAASKSYAKKHPAIVFLGRLVERKGCLQLLKAINLLKNRSGSVGGNIEILVAGRGEQEPKLLSYCKKHRLENSVKFLGFVEEADKPALLASADIAVFPSTGGESFGIVLAEAMAAGAGVVLGGDNPGYRTVLEDCPEALFDPLNTAQLADKLELFIKDTKLSKQLHEKQQSMVERFDVATIGPQILGCYKAAIAKRTKQTHNKDQV